jgi:ribosome-associated protein
VGGVNLPLKTMRRPDERTRNAPPAEAPAAAVSKTRRKAEMHALQELGEALVELEPSRLDVVAADAALPERLVEAIVQARGITAWGGRRRQLQYVGRLMRDVDPEPIRRRLAMWAQGRDEDAARIHALERWRTRLLEEPAALDELAAAHPGLDRPRFRALIAKARDERARGTPPHAYRELYRELKAIDVAR